MGDKVLVTGGTGFVGSALIGRLLSEPAYEITAAVRKKSASLPARVNPVMVGDLASNIDWANALKKVKVVIHAAARAHIMKDTAVDPLSEYRKINTEATLNLARHAASCGVKRFIFISSIKVNGESTPHGRPCHADDTPQPVDPYGISKVEAEYGLKEIAARSGMEVVIIRPPLVYGPGVKANFLSMMSWIYRGIPLPLGAIHNKRSFVSVYNLADLIVCCMTHPKAANQVFFAGDGEDLSTTELLLRVGQALEVPVRLIPVPMAWIEKGASLLGKEGVARRLCGNLQVDIKKTRELLDWAPPVSIDEALRKTAEVFKRGGK